MDPGNSSYIDNSQDQSHLFVSTIRLWFQPGEDKNSTLLDAGSKSTSTTWV
ncbi:hypothetical protein LEMLEM_LOCUS16156 [Lemmus lemmus]